jgi:hypothetical protein
VTMIPFTVLLVWSAWVLARAVPDLWSSRTVTGEVVRARRFRRWSGSSNAPRYWYYLAVDDGTESRIAAWRLKETTWREHTEGNTVTALITPRLGYVRSMEAVNRSSDRGG